MTTLASLRTLAHAVGRCACACLFGFALVPNTHTRTHTHPPLPTPPPLFFPGVPTLPWSGDGVTIDYTSCPGGVIPEDVYAKACVHRYEHLLFLKGGVELRFSGGVIPAEA